MDRVVFEITPRHDLTSAQDKYPATISDAATPSVSVTTSIPFNVNAPGRRSPAARCARWGTRAPQDRKSAQKVQSEPTASVTPDSEKTTSL
jgi:hypothetical protein